MNSSSWKFPWLCKKNMFSIFFFNTFFLFSSLHFSHLYASGKVGLRESAVVGRGQWWEEEGEEDDYLEIWINLYFGNGNVWKVIIWGLLVWISKTSELELLGIQKSDLVHWGRRTDREEGEVGQHLAGVGWTDLEFHYELVNLWWRCDLGRRVVLTQISKSLNHCVQEVRDEHWGTNLILKW